MAADEQKKIRVVDFSEAGEGIVLLFRNRDFLALQNKFGDNYMNEAPERLDRFDMVFIETCLRVGPKTADGKPTIVDMDRLDQGTMAELRDKILDAITLSASGRTFLEHIAWINEQAMKLVDDLSPKKGPGNSSAGSDELLSEPELLSPNSGT